ncbi:Bgt-20160 [Blumeria graminis f. sp. tritici]|uniref:Bgt-20160 n=2 Tax=Blumeria graminis f. sp. tritici TaxID=62690 RepID=A0A9X9QFL2_BLUGR|nr:Bgt-20160 [Blumeria graminis f. sp. tritici]
MAASVAEYNQADDSDSTITCFVSGSRQYRLYTCPECANRAHCRLYVWIFTYYSVPWLIMVDEGWLVIIRFDRHMRLVEMSPLRCIHESNVYIVVKYQVFFTSSYLSI